MTITIASDPILNFGLTAEAHFDKIQKELQTSKCSFSPYLLASHILCQPHFCMINLFLQIYITLTLLVMGLQNKH